MQGSQISRWVAQLRSLHRRRLPKPHPAHHRRRFLEPLEVRTVLSALQLDGVNDYATASDHTSLDLGVADGEDFTIEASFYVSDPSDDSVSALVITNWGYELAINFNPSQSEYVFRNVWTSPSSIGKWQLGNSADIPAGWHHIASTYYNEHSPDWGLFTPYLDGSRLAYSTSFEVTPGLYSTTPPLNVGGIAGAGSLGGWMDEVRLSALVRYSGSSYAMPTAPFPTDSHTLALWHFDEPVGSTNVADASTNGNTLTGVSQPCQDGNATWTSWHHRDRCFGCNSGPTKLARCEY